MGARDYNRRSEVKEMTWPAVKLALTQEQFRDYVEKLPASKWRPSMIVWHNTAAPSLAQWIKSANADKVAGKIPGESRIVSLERFFREDNHWSGAPHLFIANDFIWVFNPLTSAGVHSPSWNSISFGIEMIGDFAVEDDDSGEGLKVKQNTIYATAVLCEAFGIDPQTQIMLHKQDPRTTHDCPGKDIAQDKLEMIRDVAALMTGGDHNPEDIGKIISGQPVGKTIVERHVITTVNGLNFRTGPSALSVARSQIPKGTDLVVLDSAANGADSWLKVRSPAGYIGWVAGKYTEPNRGD